MSSDIVLVRGSLNAVRVGERVRVWLPAGSHQDIGVVVAIVQADGRSSWAIIETDDGLRHVIGDDCILERLA